METNIYRCTEPCDNCPFINRDALHISEERLDEIKADLDAGGNFICHKTAYPDVFNEEDIGRRMCYGAWKYLKDAGKPNQIMQIAERLGTDE